MALTLYVARLLRKLCEQRLRKYIPVDTSVVYVLVRLSQYLVWAIAVFIVFTLLNVDLTGIALILGALGVGVGFGLQSIVSNFFAGLIILFEGQIKVNDRVTIEDLEGNVAEINFRSTTIVTNDNISVIVPNSELINRSVINWSHGDSLVRIHVPVGVAYRSDTQLVTDTLLEVATQTEDVRVLSSPPPRVRFNEFGESSLAFELLVWTDEPTRHRRLRSELNYAIDTAFAEKGITIPFPQRDLHIKSGLSLSSQSEQ